MESLILDKKIIVLFEKSDTTLDGINRGNFGRPIVYIFILDNNIPQNIETFVNQDMIVNGNAIKSEYNIDFPVLFTENFDLSSVRVSAWVNASHGKANVNKTGRATTTWAELKRSLH